MSVRKKNQLMGSKEMAHAIDKLASEIIREFSDNNLQEVALIGIQTKGVPLATRLQKKIFALTGNRPLLGTLDTCMYRDDIRSRKVLPIIQETNIPFDVNCRDIILVDDVFSTGRTIRGALDAITDYGRPNLIRLAVLVDRKNHEFPIKPDFKCIDYHGDIDEKVHVFYSEKDGEDKIFVE